jgi:soluble lytic murein transglycosylase
LKAWARWALLGGACLILADAADAQNDAPATGASDSAPAPAPAPSQAATAIVVQTPQIGYRPGLSDQDQASLRQGLSAAMSGDVERARSLQASLSDPVAKKLILWAMVDQAGERLSFFELDQGRRDLWGWPRSQRRQMVAEKAIESQSMPPKAVIDWFKGSEPVSAEGAMALAAAYRASGRADDAASLIRRFWREKVFEAEPQRQMYNRFGDVLTQDDHARREDMLLYGQQGPASRDLIPLLSADQQELARVRIAFRNGQSGAELTIEHLPPELQDDPGLNFERARHLVRQKEAVLALSLLKRLPSKPPGDEAAAAVWQVRKALVGVALTDHDYQAAYEAAAKNGLSSGTDYAEAEFYAGWIALTKLKKPELAEEHFAHIEQVGSSPITQGRALYWRARAVEASGDGIGARDLYAQAAQFPTTFYGQLAAEKAGQAEIEVGRDPPISPADRARFDGREIVQAIRMLHDGGQSELFRTFVLSAADTLPKAEEYALLVDLCRSYGEQDLSMRVARAGATHGYVLPERGYPLLNHAVSGGGSAEPALVLSIARQESNFDPYAKSGPGARGMMQLMPRTAQVVARRMGEPYSLERLFDADYNVRLGGWYLGNMVDSFGGSYVMATASYNAGPNHMPEWTAVCGDPRTATADPVDFIECIPFSETRNYVMRVMETTEVYRARLNGGRAALTLSRDLRRGNYMPPQAPLIASNAAQPASGENGSSGTMAPIPN